MATIYLFDQNQQPSRKDAAKLGVKTMREVKAEQRSAEWFEARKGRITGSKIGAILGLSPFQTREDVLRAMVREYHQYPSEFEGNQATQWGTFNEDNAAFELLIETGIDFRECGLVIHPDHKWLAASPDGVSLCGRYIREIKCPYSKKDKGDFVSVFEQLHYYAQVQYEMFCTGINKAIFFQWSPVRSKVEFVEFDQAFIDKTLPEMHGFYLLYCDAIKQPQKHLEPKRKKVEFDVEPYLQAKKAYEEAKLAFENRREELIDAARATGKTLVDFGLVKATFVAKKGAIDYKKIPELKDVDLEAYRIKDSKYWTIR